LASCVLPSWPSLSSAFKSSSAVDFIFRLALD
jgi:hypothetical protein